jgi:flagellar hook-associated protein 1 FlgK
MSISQALSTALSGLHATQAGMSLIAANVANAQTPDYVRKSLDLAASTSGVDGSSVHVVAVNRELDQYLQKQLRVETSGGAYADLRSQFYQRLQTIYGDPNSQTSLDSLYNTFTGALQSLVTSPDSTAAQSLVLSSAQALTQTLNATSENIQGLRSDAESGLADSVAAANNAMQKIADINVQLAGRTITNASDAALADERDSYVNQLAELMDIRVVDDGHNSVSVFTNSGVQLVGTSPAKLSFNPQGTVSATTLWDADPTKSNLGTLTLVSANGTPIDLIATKSIRSGKIAAYLDMRDNVLVQAQNQLDSLASAMAQSLSNQTVDGTAVSSPPQNGFDIDTAGLLNGNTINLTYTDTATNTQHRVSLVRVDDPSALPLDNSVTPDPNDEVIGVDFSGGLASAVAQLNARFGGALQFSNPSGTTLEVLDDGAANTTDVNALSVTKTATALANGSVSLALFTDGTIPFTGAINPSNSQSTGFSGRIAVNPAVLGNPRSLTLYDTNTASGDPTRPNFIYNQLTGTPFAFSSQTGLGNAGSPFTGNVPSFLRQVLSMQGENASNASNLAQGQDVVVNALQQRVNEASGVNVDQEMANLISLQTAYGANARVMTAVRDMIDVLMKI